MPTKTVDTEGQNRGITQTKNAQDPKLQNPTKQYKMPTPGEKPTKPTRKTQPTTDDLAKQNPEPCKHAAG